MFATRSRDFSVERSESQAALAVMVCGGSGCPVAYTRRVLELNILDPASMPLNETREDQGQIKRGFSSSRDSSSATRAQIDESVRWRRLKILKALKDGLFSFNAYHPAPPKGKCI